MVCFAHRQFGTTLPLATVSSQKGQRSGQSRRAIYITCSSLKWDLVHIGFTSRLTGVGVHPGWLYPWFGPGCADLSSRAASSRCCRCRCGGFQDPKRFQHSKSVELANPPHQAVCAGSSSSRQI